MCVCQPGSVPVERSCDPEGQQAVGHQRRGDGPTQSPRPRHASCRGKKQLMSFLPVTVAGCLFPPLSSLAVALVVLPLSISLCPVAGGGEETF